MLEFVNHTLHFIALYYQFNMIQQALKISYYLTDHEV